MSQLLLYRAFLSTFTHINPMHSLKHSDQNTQPTSLRAVAHRLAAGWARLIAYKRHTFSSQRDSKQCLKTRGIETRTVAQSKKASLAPGHISGGLDVGSHVIEPGGGGGAFELS